MYATEATKEKMLSTTVKNFSLSLDIIYKPPSVKDTEIEHKVIFVSMINKAALGVNWYFLRF